MRPLGFSNCWAALQTCKLREGAETNFAAQQKCSMRMCVLLLWWPIGQQHRSARVAASAHAHAAFGGSRSATARQCSSACYESRLHVAGQKQPRAAAVVGVHARGSRTAEPFEAASSTPWLKLHL